jgi:hypothetical protein
MKRGVQLLVSGLALAVVIGAIIWTVSTHADPASDMVPPDCNPMPGSTEKNSMRPVYEDIRLGPPVAKRVLPEQLDTIVIVLPQGECFTEVYACTIPEIPPVADILLDFDLTGSMGEELLNLKVNSVAIMSAIRQEVNDCNFGLISGEDYNATYSHDENCGYGWRYGFNNDEPYRLDIPLTSDLEAVKLAIDAMQIGYGQDCPECYATRFFESVAELLGMPHPTFGPIGWREEAKKIVLAFNDAVPHDCDWTACSGVPPSGPCVTTLSSGRDPGRDGLANTADDVAIMDVLLEMAAKNISLVDVYSGPWSLKVHWDCWTEMTPGGGAFQINENGTIPGGMSIDSFIVEIIKSTFDTVDVVAPEVCEGDPVFVVSVEPPSYENVPTPSILEFEFELCVPEEMDPGTYCFDICYLADGGEVRRETYCIEVIEPTTFVDIKPGSCPNPLNVKSQGVLPVAILGRAGLDVSIIDVSSVRLEGVAPIRSHIHDAGSPFYRREGRCDCIQGEPDGFDDLNLKFRTQEIVAALGDIEDRDTLELYITATTLEGEELPVGYDCMVIIHNEWRKINRESDGGQGKDGLSSGQTRFGIVGISPNPTSRQARIAYNVPEPGEVSVRIYDLAGRLVETLFAGDESAGEHTVDWDGRDAGGRVVPTGVYLCVLTGPDARDVAKLTLMP